MLLKWNGKHVWSIGSGLGDGSVIQIIPGPNDLTKIQWDAIKEHPVVKERMEKDVIDEKRGKIKMLELVSVKKSDDSDDDNDDDTNEGLGGVSVGDAKKIIVETFNTELLRKWDEEETRKGVKTAIEKQLEAIKKDREDEGGNADVAE